MQIKQAVESDITEIVNLLKISLGESLMPKSEQYWRWKHVDNPFGASPVLLAVEDNMIVGVRAFMRWGWIRNLEKKEAVRAVDTATHPDYQGKGIFSKLTLALLEQCKSEHIDFVFNTPNDKSTPGYLKMGWKTAGKIPVNFKIARPLKVAINLVRPAKAEVQLEKNSFLYYFLTHPGLEKLLENHRTIFSSSLITSHTARSLQWRYMEVPVAQYHAAGIEKNGLSAIFIFRLKTSRFGLELRVTDVFLDSLNQIRQLKNIINEIIRQYKVDYVTTGSFIRPAILSGIFSGMNTTMGPMVTIRDIDQEEVSGLVLFRHWSPSMGDMELF